MRASTGTSFVFLSLVSCVLTLPRSFSHLECPTRLIYAYPTTGPWIENLAIRSNGDILFTSIGEPGGLSLLKPFSPQPKPISVLPPSAFEGVNSTLGIVEAEHDVFYVLGNNFSLAQNSVGVSEGTNAVFRVDFNHWSFKLPYQYPAMKPKIERLRQYGPDVKFFNGLAKFNSSILLAADSKLGAIWAINTKSGDISIAAQDPLMAPLHGRVGLQEGVNGLSYRDSEDYIYFTNSQKRVFARVRFLGLPVEDAAELVAESVTQSGVEVEWDDFALDSWGNAWVATQMGNSVQRIGRNGEVMVVAGNVNSTVLAEPTSASFGRTWRDRGILYVATAGGLGVPVYQQGNAVRLGSQIVAVDTRMCVRHSGEEI